MTTVMHEGRDHRSGSGVQLLLALPASGAACDEGPAVLGGGVLGGGRCSPNGRAAGGGTRRSGGRAAGPAGCRPGRPPAETACRAPSRARATAASTGRWRTTRGPASARASPHPPATKDPAQATRGEAGHEDRDGEEREPEPGRAVGLADVPAEDRGGAGGGGGDQAGDAQQPGWPRRRRGRARRTARSARNSRIASWRLERAERETRSRR